MDTRQRDPGVFFRPTPEHRAELQAAAEAEGYKSIAPWAKAVLLRKAKGVLRAHGRSAPITQRGANTGHSGEGMS